MDKQYFNKGYSLLEGVIVLWAISYLSCSVISIPFKSFLSFLEISEINDEISLSQYNAMYDLNTTCYKSITINSKYPVCFNANGNVNHAQTVLVKTKSNLFEIVIQLGSGKHEIK